MLRRIVGKFRNIIKRSDKEEAEGSFLYEYCPRCNADLIFQKGYNKDYPFWVCRGCGEMLINPEVDADDDIAWICDGCGEMLNIQEGFLNHGEEWTCTECGFVNKITESELYESEEEYQASLRNPYKGLSNEAVCALSVYRDLEYIADREDILLVEHKDSGARYVKKLLVTYDKSVYEFLRDNPIAKMPRIVELHRGDNCLIVIEEYIDGLTIAEKLADGVIPLGEAVRIAKCVCVIMNELHSLPVPIIHRDIKPSNIIVKPDGEVYLLDMNVAKWYDPEKTDDTRYMGTRYFAAPEQVGYGLKASSAKADVYAVGVLLNVMLTGKFPKEERAEGDIRVIIEKCMSLNADDRYSDIELIKALDLIEV